ncbi:MAG: metal ABC transporter substrate-binding protein, partial [Woeseiaceae bacterium]
MKSSWKVMYASAKRLGLLACTFVAVACAPQEQGGEAVEGPRGPAQVYSVNYPLAYFAERIAGDTVNVVFPAPADVDPASWSPTNETVASFQSADLMLLNGAGYADWIQRVSLSQSRLVNTSAALADRLIPVDDDTTHSHGPGGDHSHKDMAFTTWLDVELAIGQARAVFDALVHLRP